jgi:hypothetical protein
VDLLDATRRVPLRHACEDVWLDTRCIALFLEFMADLNRMDPDGLTPLELLEHRGFHCLRVWMKARTLLVDKGARRTDGIRDEGAVREKCQFKTCKLWWEKQSCG